MKPSDREVIVFHIEITPTWRKIAKAFWIGYLTVVALCLLLLVLF